MPFFSRPIAAPLPYDPRSPEGLAARWVRWVAGIGPTKSPIADETGERAGIDQPGDVWFLAGTFGGAVRRHCVVPAGVPLFLPAVNMWEAPASGSVPVLEQGFGRVALDGDSVDVQPASAIAFDVAGTWFNPVTRTRRVVPVSVWGLWAHVPPLAPGAHEVVLEGGDGHGFLVGAAYTLDVAAG